MNGVWSLARTDRYILTDITGIGKRVAEYASVIHHVSDREK